MLVSQANKVLLRNAVWKADNILSVGVTRCLQNKTQTQEFIIIRKRYSRTSSEEKKRCEENPKKSRKLLTLATVAVIGTTASVIAAKYDDDFRDWTKEHVPVIDKMVKVVFQEEETYLESLDKAHKELSAWIKDVVYAMIKSKDRQDRLGSADTIPDLDSTEGGEGKKPYKLPDSAIETKGGDDSSKPGKEPKEIKELKDLEDRFGKAAQETVKTANETISAIKDEGKLIDFLDQIISSNDRKIWKKLKKRHEDAVKGEENAKTSFERVNALGKQLESKVKDATTLSEDVKSKVHNNVITVMKGMKDALDKIAKEKESNVLTKRSWGKVKDARMHFSEELETLFPNVWLNDQNLNISVDELEPFITNTLNNIEFLDMELIKLQTIYEGNLNYALEWYKNYGQEAFDDVVDAAVAIEVSKIKRDFQAAMQKELLKFKAKCEKNAKALLKQRAEVYKELTAEALKIKEKDVERKINQLYEERLAELRAQYNLEIAKMVGRIQGANQAIAQRGTAEKSQQEKLQFWSAAQSFVAAIKPIGAKSSGCRSLKNEVANIKKVKPEGDKLVDSVLDTIPEEALNRGVYSETRLRERFFKVMKCAKSWAGVPPGEVSLLQVLLARVQSALYLDISIPQAELDNEPVIDPEQLNNYDILYRAKYYVDRGEFDQAIRYLNLLKGPSAKVASDWIWDTILYLETKQAAELLLAYATAANP